jgi:hypothetical protein
MSNLISAVEYVSFSPAPSFSLCRHFSFLFLVRRLFPPPRSCPAVVLAWHSPCWGRGFLWVSSSFKSTWVTMTLLTCALRRNPWRNIVCPGRKRREKRRDGRGGTSSHLGILSDLFPLIHALGSMLMSRLWSCEMNCSFLLFLQQLIEPSFGELCF